MTRSAAALALLYLDQTIADHNAGIDRLRFVFKVGMSAQCRSAVVQNDIGAILEAQMRARFVLLDPKVRA